MLARAPRLCRPFFQMRQADAAERLGIAASTLKHVCRQLGIGRWPCRSWKSQESDRARPTETLATLLAAGDPRSTGQFCSAPKVVLNWPPGADEVKTKHVKMTFTYSVIPPGRGSTPEPEKGWGQKHRCAPLPTPPSKGDSSSPAKVISSTTLSPRAKDPAPVAMEGNMRAPCTDNIWSQTSTFDPLQSSISAIRGESVALSAFLSLPVVGQ
jgi:hypothetical protein